MRAAPGWIALNGIGLMAELSLRGNPFQAIPSADGCHVFVSLAGPSEPGDPPRPPRPGAPKGGVAVVSRAGGTPALVRVVTLEGSPYGMVLTHDGRLPIVASDDRVAFLDVPRLIAGSDSADAAAHQPPPHPSSRRAGCARP